MMNALFGAPKKSPQEQAKEWKKQLSHEGRNIDRQVRKIQLAEKKTMLSAKQAAKQNDVGAVRILSKEILHSRKAVNRMMTTKTHMNSVSMQIQMQLSQMKMVGALQKSTHIMSGMNELCKVNEVGQVMQSMSREMMKAGLMDEMMDDAMDDALDDGVDEDELDEEVSKLVTEVMQAKMAGTRVTDSKLPQKEAVAEPEVEVEEDEDEDELMAKYAALRARVS
jgi:charged multivesicular body protein 3